MPQEKLILKMDQVEENWEACQPLLVNVRREGEAAAEVLRNREPQADPLAGALGGLAAPWTGTPWTRTPCL